ncbi:unnamed protein product [Orchesella dallaii]|uniref:Uncharacterized protein n=1 Tax=Orchesella dallaii TaxID=48710 RepID=A0ABP1PWI7_9HEXA
MAKRMKLIPASLYDRLMAQHSDKPSDEVSTNQILDSDLPDEIKAKLYQEFKRNQRGCKTAEDNIPMMVQLKEAHKPISQSVPETKKEVSLPPADPPRAESPPPHYATPQASPVRTSIKSPVKETWASVTAKRINDFLQTINIEADDGGQVLLDGKPIPGSNLKLIVQNLSDARFKKTFGYTDVINYIANTSIPLGMFSLSVMNDIKQCNAKPIRESSSTVTRGGSTKSMKWETMF